MRQFTDLLGTVWEISITVGSARRVKAAIPEADLLAFASGCQFGRIATDPEFLADVLYEIVKPQAETRGITAEAFGERLAGESLGSASEALMRAIADFFQAQAVRDALHQMIDLMKSRIEEIAKAAVDAAQTRSGGTSIDAPESSESIPTHSP